MKWKAYIACLVVELLFRGLASAATQETQITLAWDPPTRNQDGSDLTDLAGFKVYRGLAPGVYTDSYDVGDTTSATVTGLEEGRTYYFVVTACNRWGGESAYSGELAWTATADTDGDGMNNEDESLAGTAPDNPLSVLSLTHITEDTDGRIALHWQSVEGRRYSVFRATSLNGPFVPVATSLAATPPDNVYYDTPAGATALFYRIQLVP